MLDRTLREHLDQVAAPAPTATGGGVGAVTAASAAGLVTMTARLCPALDDAAELVARAEQLRCSLTSLAEEDEHSYEAVLAAQRRDSADPERPRALREALRGAARPPLRVARASAEVAVLAADLAGRAKRAVRGDAVTACALAAASARSAAALARENLAAAAKLDEPDPRGLEGLAPSLDEEAEVVARTARRAQDEADALLDGPVDGAR